MANGALLSICIPTYKREEILTQLIHSILSQEVDTSLYEICITDNSETDETKQVIETQFSHVPNLVYKKVVCKGFLNSIEALKLGQGKFLKLHNDYSIFNQGALAKIIGTLQLAEQEHAEPFFTLGKLNNPQDIMIFDDYDSFMYNISLQATWSSAFCIWKESFDAIMETGVVPNYMYPHTSFLHRATDYPKYLVDNAEYVTNVEPKKKGGYNLVDNFVRIYLTMVKEDLLQTGAITQRTYERIEDDILNFCAEWYYTVKRLPERYTFRFDDEEKIVEQTCGSEGLQKYRKYKKINRVKHVGKTGKMVLARMIKKGQR